MPRIELKDKGMAILDSGPLTTSSLTSGKISLFPCGGYMLAKKTVKNQITLPKTVVSRFGNVEYFDVSTDGETIVLRPLRESRADDVRAQLEKLGISESDVTDAVTWARAGK